MRGHHLEHVEYVYKIILLEFIYCDKYDDK
jgi:hypothetical protein